MVLEIRLILQPKLYTHTPLQANPLA